ncbi:ATP-dependent Clp protease ATP-binding subunit ClpX [Arhodomonas aquaeolei]|uniref:ATP-dependent Clp protease ATP-binding subunit ClpX n=1 Tax=Arhodomonas aquaeolei TaxID=2369 RepID=UPI00036B20BE|nr:ATP-dependent Clp protease ATP-binding subunit ClpX [Arhodomonas aquaeolei]
MVRSAERKTIGDGHRGATACAFCGSVESAANTLVATGAVSICARCATECARILAEEGATERALAPAPLPTPSQIHAFLDEYVIGQTRGKRSLAVAVYNHYKRLRRTRSPGEPKIGKSNVLLLGPSGSGKTLLAETLARSLAVPFVSIDATGLTEAGYVGEDVDVIAERLLQAADGDIGLAGCGIVYIDEIDKLAAGADSPVHGRDVSAEGVQQSLLRFLEGTRVPLPQARRSPRAPIPELDTREVLFICGGAFDGIDALVRRRQLSGGVGFAADPAGEMAETPPLAEALSPEDLMAYGLIPELVGRLPVTAVLDPLDAAGLCAILTEPRNALVAQYQSLMAMDGCRLTFGDDALEAIAEEALASGTGARALRGVLERVLLEPMFVAGPGTLHVDAAHVADSRLGACRRAG